MFGDKNQTALFPLAQRVIFCLDEENTQRREEEAGGMSERGQVPPTQLLFNRFIFSERGTITHLKNKSTDVLFSNCLKLKTVVQITGMNRLFEEQCGHRELNSHSFYLLSSGVRPVCHLALSSCLLPHNLPCFKYVIKK